MIICKFKGSQLQKSHKNDPPEKTLQHKDYNMKKQTDMIKSLSQVGVRQSKSLILTIMTIWLVKEVGLKLAKNMFLYFHIILAILCGL